MIVDTDINKQRKQQPTTRNSQSASHKSRTLGSKYKTSPWSSFAASRPLPLPLPSPFLSLCLFCDQQGFFSLIHLHLHQPISPFVLFFFSFFLVYPQFVFFLSFLDRKAYYPPPTPLSSSSLWLSNNEQRTTNDDKDKATKQSVLRSLLLRLCAPSSALSLIHTPILTQLPLQLVTVPSLSFHCLLSLH